MQFLTPCWFTVKIKFPSLTVAIINGLRQHGISHMMAPFEADIQLKRLVDEGCAHAVMSEDGDMIVYGLRILIWGWNWHQDLCCVLERTTVEAWDGDAEAWPLLGAIRKHGWDAVLGYAMLVGNDYFVRGAPHVGPGRAGPILLTFKRVSPEDLHATLQSYTGPGASQIKRGLPANFIQCAHNARVCFKHAIVYSPRTKSFVSASPVPPDKDYSHLLGVPPTGRAEEWSAGFEEGGKFFIRSPPSATHPQGEKIELAGPHCDGLGKCAFFKLDGKSVWVSLPKTCPMCTVALCSPTGT
jgi:hypothetical protein